MHRTQSCWLSCMNNTMIHIMFGAQVSFSVVPRITQYIKYTDISSKWSSSFSLKLVILFVTQSGVCQSKLSSCFLFKFRPYWFSLKYSSCLSIKNVILFVTHNGHLVCPSILSPCLSFKMVNSLVTDNLTLFINQNINLVCY